MLIKIDNFTGISPRMEPEKLQPNAAQEAIDCNFNSGAIVGLRGHTTYSSYTAGAAIKAGFSYSTPTDSKLYTWTYDADAVRSPALNDTHKRFYWTGDNGGTTEFRFSLSTQSSGYVGAPGTSYKVGVIDSKKWDNTLGVLGIEFTVRPKGVPIEMSELTDGVFEVWLANESGALVKDITGVPVVGVGTAVRGWYPSYTITLPQALGSYAQKSASAVTYTRKDTTVFFGYGGSSTEYEVTLWYAGTVLKFAEIKFPTPYGYPEGMVAGSPVFLSKVYAHDGGDMSTYNTTESLGQLYFRAPGVLSYDAGVDLPAELSDDAGDAALPDTLYLALKWGFTHNGQSYATTFYESASLSGSLDIAGGISASLVRSAGDAVFTLTPKFGVDQPIEQRAYVMTLVNGLSEESEPSNAVELSLNPGTEEVVVVFTPATWAAGITANNIAADRYPLHTARFYRTATSSSGQAEFLYAFSISGGVTSPTDADALPGDTYLQPTILASTWEIEDTIAAASLGAACPTQDFIYDTSVLQELQGLTAIHNGMLAAFKGNEVWVCEPYMPWAYKSNAIQSLPHKVVALAAADQGFYALTEQGPYFLSGNLPEELMFQKLPSNLPCINKRAACQVGSTVMYLSADGPVIVSGGQANLDPSFSRETWRDEYAARAAAGKSMGLATWGNRVLAYFIESTHATPGYLFDSEDKAWTDTSTRIDYALALPAGALGKTHDSLLFVAGGAQWKFFADDGNNGAWTWQSKDFVLPKPSNFGISQLRGSGTAVLKVYANGALKLTSAALTLSAEGVKVRLPSGFLDTKWSFRVEGAAGARLLTLSVATAGAELQNG